MSNNRFGATLVFGILAIGSTLAAHHECDKDLPHYCHIMDVTIESETDASALTIEPQSLAVYIEDPIITYFPPDLMDNPSFNSMQYFGIINGKVPEMHLKPTLLQVEAKRNQLETFVIPAVDNIQLSRLFITENLITKIPKNIEFCKQLESITLSGNEIESVDLSVFNGLTKLRQISLDQNRIHSVDATVDLRIPSLVILSLDSNELRNLDMKQWRFPALEHLYLGYNMLTTTDISAERFPNLELLHLHDNPWSCTWLQGMFKSLKDKGLNVDHAEDKDCGDRVRLHGICCMESAQPSGASVLGNRISKRALMFSK